MVIILGSKQVVILTPPRTGSRYLSRILCTSEYNGLFCIGPWTLNSKLDHHSMIIPREFIDWPRYLLVRNPLIRLISLYKYYCEHHEQDNVVVNKPGNLSWEQYVDLVIRDEATKLYPFYRWTISRLIEPLDRVDEIIKLYELDKRIQELLGIEIELKMTFYNLEEYYSDKVLLNQVLAWGQSDFLRFNYASS